MSHAPDPAHLEVEQRESTLLLRLSGDWVLEQARPAFPADRLVPPVERLAFDCRRLGRWNTGLLTFLLAGADASRARRMVLEPDGLPRHARSLLELATAVPEKEDARHQEPPRSLVERVGRAALQVATDAQEMVSFLGECTRAAAALVRGRARLRLRDFFHVVEECGPNALPIVGLISLLVGLIIAFLGALILQRMGAEIYVSYIVGYGMLRELGALMTGVIMAGRTGAAFAAEIGSMKVSEEIDALKTLGISPIEFLVLPRLLALALMMPLLTSFANAIGIFGGYLICAGMLDTPGSQFFGGLRDILSITDVMVGLVKGLIFGVIVAFAGCLRGMQCGSSAGAVGIAATSAVVTSITLIILANALVDWVTILYEL